MESLKERELRDKFFEAVNGLMRDLDYTVIACVIKKPEHVAQYGRHAIDPYMYSLDIIVGRFCRVVGPATNGAMILAEKRSPVLDHQLDTAWETFKSVGTDYVGRSAIDDRVVDLSLKDKRLNIAGLQLADLVVSPIGRAVMGKPTREDWEIVKGKLRRDPKGYEGYGLVVRA